MKAATMIFTELAMVLDTELEPTTNRDLSQALEAPPVQ